MTGAFALLHDLLPIWIGTVWIASIAWVWHDARLRIRNSRTVAIAILGAALAPLAGAAAWALVRPAETLEERRCRRLVRLLAELEAGPEPYDAATDPAPARRRLAIAR